MKEILGGLNVSPLVLNLDHRWHNKNRFHSKLRYVSYYSNAMAGTDDNFVFCLQNCMIHLHICYKKMLLNQAVYHFIYLYTAKFYVFFRIQNDVGEVIFYSCPTSPFFKLRVKWFHIGYIERIFLKTAITSLQNYRK